jgi:hypothetical protein
LDLETGRVMTFLYDFMRLQNMHKAATILKEYKDQLAPLVKMFVAEEKRHQGEGHQIRS